MANQDPQRGNTGTVVADTTASTSRATGGTVVSPRTPVSTPLPPPKKGPVASPSSTSPLAEATSAPAEGPVEVNAPSAVTAAPSTPIAVGGPGSLLGTVLAERYRVIKELGEGGMGTVYLAEHTTINKKLAIKVLSPEFSHKQDLVDRFLQEARAASMISQENVVEITDFGSTPGGSVFFVMEYLVGEDLSETIKREGPLPWHRVRGIMLQICRALQAAHDSHIIHRDMKPENCFRIRRGSNEDFIKVLDFGIAKVTGDEAETGGKGLTRTGMIFGTPEYMSPEQAQGSRPDHRVDVYALGVILYELLTGRVPFMADTFMGILTKHMFEAPVAPSVVAPHADIPLEAEAIILKALQKDRDLRFQSMSEMALAIETVGSGAAPVTVVQETLNRPTEGRVGYQTALGRAVPGAQGVNTGAASTLVPELDDPPGRGHKVWLGVGALLLLVAGGSAATFFGASDPPAVPASAGAGALGSDAAVAVDPGGTPALRPQLGDDTKAEAGDSPPDPRLSHVTLRVATPGVEAKIVDAKAGEIYGPTNTADGVKVPRSSQNLDLVLRAEGYEDLPFSMVPDADRVFEKTLVKVAAKPVPRQGGKAEPAQATEGRGPSSGQGKDKSDGSGSAPDARTSGRPEAPKASNARKNLAPIRAKLTAKGRSPAATSAQVPKKSTPAGDLKDPFGGR